MRDALQDVRYRQRLISGSACTRGEVVVRDGRRRRAHGTTEALGAGS